MKLDRVAFLTGAQRLFSRRRKQPKAELHGPDDGANPSEGEQPVRSFEPTPPQGWHPQETKHRRREGWYWLASMLLSLVIAVGAGFSARYAYKAASEAHEQAVQARRQANTAESQLVATTRARLKLAAITGAYFSKAKGVNTAWFNFKLAYKNFGPSPAENISFEPYIFVIGAGPSPGKVCGTGPGWIAHEPSAEDIAFPQDEGEGTWAVQVPLQTLKEEAAKVLAVQPSQPVYMGVVGCLLYRSGSDTDTYVTGFVADLYLAGPEQDKPGKYVPLYNVLMEGNGPAEVGIEVKTTDAWAD